MVPLNAYLMLTPKMTTVVILEAEYSPIKVTSDDEVVEQLIS
jgi:hypothetical protein